MLARAKQLTRTPAAINLTRADEMTNISQPNHNATMANPDKDSLTIEEGENAGVFSWQ